MKLDLVLAKSTWEDVQHHSTWRKRKLKPPWSATSHPLTQLLSKEQKITSAGEDAEKLELLYTPVFLPGKFHGQRHLEGCSPRGHTQSNMTELLSTHTHTQGKLSLCSPNSPYPLQSNSSLVSSPSPLLWSLCSPLILSTITSHLDAHNPQHVSLPPSISQTCLHLGIFLNCESDYFTLLIKKKKCIYLASLGLSCSTRDLLSSLWCVRSSSLTWDQTWVPCIGSMEY